jgi:parallel beta-helix repeat protein
MPRFPPDGRAPTRIGSGQTSEIIRISGWPWFCLDLVGRDKGGPPRTALGGGRYPDVQFRGGAICRGARGKESTNVNRLAVSLRWLASAALLQLVCGLSIPLTGAMADTIPVTCTNPGDLQAAVLAAEEFDVLQVTGACRETFLSINSNRNGLTLDGLGAATIQDIQPGGAGAAAITVRGAHEVRIQGFSNIFSNTTDGLGVFVVDGGSASILNNTITTNFIGIQVSRSSQATIAGNTLTGNSDTGISIADSSSVRIGLGGPANTIQDSVTGIQVTRGSSARIVGNNISNHDVDGVLVQKGAYADIAGNVLQGNKNGINVTRNSGVLLGSDTGGSGPTNAPNSGHNMAFGVLCGLNSSVDGRRGTLDGGIRRVKAEEGCIDSSKP